MISSKCVLLCIKFGVGTLQGILPRMEFVFWRYRLIVSEREKERDSTGYRGFFAVAKWCG